MLYVIFNRRYLTKGVPMHVIVEVPQGDSIQEVHKEMQKACPIAWTDKDGEDFGWGYKTYGLWYEEFEGRVVDKHVDESTTATASSLDDNRPGAELVEKA